MEVIEHAEPTTDKRIILCIDLFHIVRHSFLLSVSRNLSLYVLVCGKISALKTTVVVQSQLSTHNPRDYVVAYILVDNESQI